MQRTSATRNLMMAMLARGLGLGLSLVAPSCQDPVDGPTDEGATALTYTGPCDLGCGCAAAYSMTRAMTSAWSGPLFQVVRDSDGATRAVAQTAQRTADWAGLFGPTGFCSTPAAASGVVHCYLGKLHDQSGNGNDLVPYTGIEHPGWGIDCSSASPYACSPPLAISARYGLPVLFTPYPTGLASCASGSGTCTRALPVGGAAKSVFVYLDNRQGSRCCGTNGLEEPYQGSPAGVIPGTMFAPIANFGTTGPFACSAADAYCADVDLEANAGTGDPSRWTYGTRAGDLLIEAKYAPTPSAAISVVLDGQQGDHGPPSEPINAGSQIRAGLAGDATPIQEAAHEFMLLSCATTAAQDAAIHDNVSQFYAAAAAAGSSSTCRGPADLGFLNSNSNGLEPDLAPGATLPAPYSIYSRMYAGWSLRVLNASYTGPLVRLRRDDGREAQFSSAAGCGLDPAAATWCAGHTCSVETLFCQAQVTEAQGGTWSAAHDASRCPALTQTVPAAMPTVTFDSLHGQPTMHFSGAQRLCHASTNAMAHTWSVAAIARRIAAGAGTAAVVGMTAPDAELGFGPSGDTVQWTLGDTGGASASGVSSADWHSLIAMNRGGALTLHVDGAVSAQGSSPDVAGGSKLCIGQRDASGDDPFIGDLAEVTLGYDMTGARGAGPSPDARAYADPDLGNVLFNNQQLAWGTLHGTAPDALASPRVFVRSANPAGEADVVAMGPDNSLIYYWAAPGSAWQSTQVAGPMTTFSTPSLYVRPDGEADIVAMGPDNSLVYYWATPGSAWQRAQIAGPLTTYSAPSIFVRSASPAGEADVVAMGPDNSLVYYWATPGSAWQTTQIAGALTTYSAPSIFVRSASPSGEADVVAMGPDNSLVYDWATPGSAWQTSQIEGANTTYSAPAIVVRSASPSGEADVVAMGPNNSLVYYWASSGTAWQSWKVARAMTTFSPPSIFVQPNGEADLVASGPARSLVSYSLVPGGAWVSTQVSGAQTAFSAPSIFVRSTGEADVVAAGPGHALLYALATPGSDWATFSIAGSGTTF